MSNLLKKLLRRLLIPIVAFALGMATENWMNRDRCLDAGGTWASGICQGARS